MNDWYCFPGTDVRMLGWKVFHQQLTVLLQSFSNRSISTTEFLEQMTTSEVDGKDLKATASLLSRSLLFEMSVALPLQALRLS